MNVRDSAKVNFTKLNTLLGGEATSVTSMEENSQERFWGRTQFYSFGAFQECSCDYDFDSYVEHEVSLIFFH